MNANRIERILEWFNTMPAFKTVDDIPDIPIVDAEVYNQHIAPNLIRCGAIPLSKLRVGAEYIGTCRNAERAVWNGKCFEYNRTKFSSTYKECINHFEEDDGYDLFIPLKEV